MGRQLARFALVVAMIVVGLMLCLDVVYFVRGSLEEFPTDEQQEKVRVVTAMLAVLLVAAEAVLWSALWGLKRDATSRERTTDDASSPAA